MSKKFLMISPKNRTAYNFRGNLIKEIINRGYQVTVTGPDRTDVDKIEALGVDFVEVAGNKDGTSIIGDLRYCRSLHRLIKELQPDAMLGYTIKPVVYGTIAGRLNRVKNINCMITGAGYTFTSKTAKAKALGVVVKTLYRATLKRSSAVIFQNRDDMNEFVQRRLVKPDKCRIINGSGVDMEYFASAKYPEGMCFFMLSRLLKSKGVIEYLEAARQIKESHPEVRFMLLGKYEDKMQDAVDREYVEDLVTQGIIERYDEACDVRPYYEQCSVYVLPSYREGTPRSVLEAMSMGRPIITTDTNGCRETVKDGVNGFLVPVQDSAVLAGRMLYFIEHPEAVKTMGEASREYCREKYEVNAVNRDMLKYMNID